MLGAQPQILSLPVAWEWQSHVLWVAVLPGVALGVFRDPHAPQSAASQMFFLC